MPGHSHLDIQTHGLRALTWTSPLPASVLLVPPAPLLLAPAPP